MADVPLQPGAVSEADAGFKAPKPVKAPKQDGGLTDTQSPLFRPGGAGGAPAVEPAVPASKPARTLADAEAEYVNLIGKTGKEFDKKRELLDEEIARLNEKEKIEVGKGSLKDLPKWVEPQETEVQGASAVSDLTPDWQGDLERAIGSPQINGAGAAVPAAETQDKTLIPKLVQRIKDIGKPETPSAGEAAEVEAERGEASSEIGIEPAPFILDAAEVTAGNLDGGVLDRFHQNAAIVVGGDGANGLVSDELARLEAQQVRYERGKAKIAGLKEEHGRQWLGLAESKAVAGARKEVNSAQTAERNLESQREQFLTANNYELDEVEQFEQWYKLDTQVRVGATELTPEMKTLAEASKVDHVDDLSGLKANLRLVRETNRKYQRFVVFEEGGSIPVKGGRKLTVEGREALKGKTIIKERALKDAENRELAVSRALAGIKDTLPEREKGLLDYKNLLGRFNKFVQENYVPSGEELRTNLEEVGRLIISRTNLNRISELSKEEGVKVDRSVRSRLSERSGQIKKLRDTFREAIDPGSRLSKSPDLARGLQLADQAGTEGFDAGVLSREDQMQLVLVQVLLGQAPSVDLQRGAVVRTQAAAAPAPAAEPATPPEAEKPAATPPAQTEAPVVSQMTGQELNTLGIEGLKAISSELTPDQVASLSLDLRSSLEQEGLLSANQYGRLPVVEDIANLADQLDRVPDNQVAGQLKKTVEAAKQNGEEALKDVKLLLEELRARVAGVISSDSPADADQSMMQERAKAALEKNLTSPNKTVAARAKAALKLLGAAGLMALMVSNTGGEQH